MEKKAVVLFLVMLSIGLSAVTLNYPVQESIDESIFLGKIAPGQFLELRFSRETGPQGTDRAVFWERTLIPEELIVNNTLAGNEIITWIKIPNDIRGKYSFNLTMQGDILYIKPQSKEIILEITEDVYFLEYEKDFSSYAGEELIIPMKIKSESIAMETLFLKDIEAMPLKWVEVENIKFEGIGEKEMVIKITPNEEGLYKTKLKIGRESNSYINLMEINLRVYPTIKSKLRAFGEGFSISPMIMQPFYSFLSLFGLV